MDTAYWGGDLRFGYQAVADNLPNDPQIHQEKGGKKNLLQYFLLLASGWTASEMVSDGLQPKGLSRFRGCQQSHRRQPSFPEQADRTFPGNHRDGGALAVRSN